MTINKRPPIENYERYTVKEYPLIEKYFRKSKLYESDLEEHTKPFHSVYGGYNTTLYGDWNGDFYDSLIFLDVSDSVGLYELTCEIKEKININQEYSKRLSNNDDYYQCIIQFDLSGGSFCSNIYIVTRKYTTLTTLINILKNYFDEIRLLSNNKYYTVSELKLKDNQKKYTYPKEHETKKIYIQQKMK